MTIKVWMIGMVAELILGTPVLAIGVLAEIVGWIGAYTEKEAKYRIAGAIIGTIGLIPLVLGLFGYLCALYIWQQRGGINF